MLSHIAMFRFRDDVDDADIAGLRARLLDLPAVIDSIRTYAVVRDAELTPGTWDMAVVATFDDEAGFRSYADDPRHRSVVADITAAITDRAALQSLDDAAAS